MANWGTWDPRRVLELYCLVGSHVVSIWWASLGLFMRWAGLGHFMRWVRQGFVWMLDQLSSGSGPKGHGTHNASLFLQLEDYALLVGEKHCVSGP